MSEALFVDPSAATAAVIKAGDTCYARVGDSSNAPDTFSVGAGFASCDACTGSSSSSSSSSSAAEPAPCSYPDGMPTTFTLHFTANAIYTFYGSATSGPSNLHYHWAAADVVVTRNAFGYWDAHSTPVAEYITLSLTPGLNLEGNYPDCDGTDTACAWVIEVADSDGDAADRIYFFTTFGAMPNEGQTYNFNECDQDYNLDLDNSSIGTVTVS